MKKTEPKHRKDPVHNEDTVTTQTDIMARGSTLDYIPTEPIACEYHIPCGCEAVEQGIEHLQCDHTGCTPPKGDWEHCGCRFIMVNGMIKEEVMTCGYHIKMQEKPSIKGDWKSIIYYLLYEKSTVDGVRILHEDQWPVDEIVNEIQDALDTQKQEYIQRIEKFFDKQSAIALAVSDYRASRGIQTLKAEAIELIKGKEEK